jgi:hypothetical protein
MDLMRLRWGEGGALDTFLPLDLIEGYSSLIWTERYATAGEFELHTYDIVNARQALPIDSLVSLRDTNEVMLVEDHLITTDDNGNDELKITGRSVDSFLEQRVFQGVAGAVLEGPRSYTPAQAAALVVWDAFANTSASQYDPIFPITGGATGTRDTAANNINNVKVSDSTTVTGTSQAWFFEPGYMYDKFLEILNEGGLGVRAIRPPITSAKIVSISTSATYASGGVYTKTTTANVNSLLFDIYNGVDRSADQSAVTPIVFHYSMGHISNPQYLFTKKNYKNWGYYTLADTGRVNPYPSVSGEINVGFGARFQFVDFNGKTLTSTDTRAADQITKAQVKKTQHTFFFDGEATSQAPYIYNKQYGLGDTITVVGKYGIQQDMQVTEFVRTQDSDGERGYPTLVATV